MGLFKRFAPGENKEAPKKEVEDLAAEKFMEMTKDTDAEKGRERVDKIMGGAKELWSKMTDKLSSFAGGTTERAKNLLFKSVGFVEKGAISTVEGTKSAYNYAAESSREVIDIGKMGIEKGTDALKRDYAQTKEDAKNLVDKAKMLGYTGPVLVLMGTVEGYRMVKELAKKGIDIASEKFKKAADVVKETGINLAVDGMVLALEGVLKAEEKGIDAKKWLEGKGRK